MSHSNIWSYSVWVHCGGLGGLREATEDTLVHSYGVSYFLATTSH